MVDGADAERVAQRARPRRPARTRSSAMAASENPAAFASRSSGRSSSGAAAIVRDSSLMYSSCSTNHGSIPVASATASGVAPARSAWSMVPRRPSCGARQRSSSSSARPSTLPVNRNGPGRALQAALGLLQRLGEGAADRHRLADRLHVGGEHGVGAGELLEREAGDLDDHVVQGGLEGRRGLAGDVVGYLVQRVADREPGGDLGDREAGGLGRQRALTGRPAGSSR